MARPMPVFPEVGSGKRELSQKGRGNGSLVREAGEMGAQSERPGKRELSQRGRGNGSSECDQYLLYCTVIR
jgi:hypothetical protein